ncbi:hypothetical protein ACFZDF_19830 [Streptomyces sp. NPDC007910]|uniref:hypothetical protein n=1 Tax=unclassified Streptomyces TaxID=2593676 RepID=UPI0036ED4B26
MAPALPRTHHSEPERAPLTLWEASVIATYQVAFTRKASTKALPVPHLVAEQLLACASHDMPVPLLAHHDSALPAEALLEQRDHENLTCT